MNPGLACKRCVENGVACGPKVGGQKRRILDNEQSRAHQIVANEVFKDHMVDHEVEEIILQPLYLDEEVPERIDSQCLGYFFGRALNSLTDCCYEGFGVKRFLIQRFGFNLPKAIKYAVILSARTDHGIQLDSAQTSRCLDLFYRYTQKAISRNAYMDIVFGCYFILTFAYGFDGWRLIDEIAYHATGFLLSLRGLIDSETLSSDEVFLLYRMWSKLSFRITMADGYPFPGIYGKGMVDRKALLPVFQIASPLLLRTNCTSQHHGDVCLSHYLSGETLVHQLDLYFRYYIAQKDTLRVSGCLKEEMSREIGTRLREVISMLLACAETQQLMDYVSRIELTQVFNAIPISALTIHESRAVQLIECHQLLLEWMVVCNSADSTSQCRHQRSLVHLCTSVLPSPIKECGLLYC